MSTDENVENILIELDKDLPAASNQTRIALLEIYRFTTKIIIEGQQQQGKKEDLSKLFKELIESLQHDLIPTKKVLNEGQINQLRLEVEEKLVEFENNFLTVTDKDLFKKKFDDFVSCIRSSFDSLLKLFQSLLEQTEKSEYKNVTLFNEIEAMKKQLEKNASDNTALRERMEKMELEEIKRMKKEKNQEKQLLIRDLFLKCKIRILQKIKKQKLPKTTYDICTKQGADEQSLLAVNPGVHKILVEVSQEFGIEPKLMLLYLQQKKKSNETFHLDDEFKSFAKARMLTQDYSLTDFLVSQNMHPLDHSELTSLQPVFTKVCQMINHQI